MILLSCYWEKNVQNTKHLLFLFFMIVTKFIIELLPLGDKQNIALYNKGYVSFQNAERFMVALFYNGGWGGGMVIVL